MINKMKIMSFILVALAVVFVIATVFVLNGCKKKDRADGKTVITVLNYTDLTTANAAPAQKWQWDTFLAANPDVALQKEDLYNEPFHEKAAAYAASGNVPDVLFVWPAGRSTPLHEKRLLKDLMPFIQRENLRSRYLPLVLDTSLQASGYLAMIPQALTASHAFFVNLEVLNACGLKPAKTYDELKAQVPLLKAKGYETVIMPNKDTWVMQSCLFSMIAGRFCGEGWENKILSGQTKFTDSDFVAALDFIRQLYADGVLAPSSLGIDYGEGPGLFSTNKGAYYIDGDWRVGDFLTNRETGEALFTSARQKNLMITVFPDIAGAKINKSNSTVLGTGWAMSASIPAGSEREDAAWRLIKWLSGVDVETRMLVDGGLSTPSRTDIDYSKLDLEPLQIMVGNLGKEYKTATVVIDDVFHADVYNPINDGLVELGLRTKTAAQVAAETQKAFDTWKAANR
ncbi:MAG: extracellular solute-binding protein [Treponema sp.]|jgi:raffinose/stachyose/melibiose transport system substrate-binding protein|nr:extracellular solute-binding protein [Treponema sp.]